MFSLHERPVRLCDRVSRRELMRVGGLSALGLSLPALLEAREITPLSLTGDKTFGRAKSVIFLWLQGGPPQHETFDPKPEAPVEIRGPFKPISTNVPGIHFCELLPRTARIADKLAVVRSISTNDNTHSSSAYWVLTGYKYVGPNARAIRPADRPYFGSIVKKFKPSEVLPPLSTVWIPDMMRLNDSVTPAGQTAGIMGRQWDPDRFLGDPADPNYQIAGLQLADLPPLRLERRISLLRQYERYFAQRERGDAVRIYNRFKQQAIDLLTTDRARRAFAMHEEPETVRRRYGPTQWGQCVLLARRLVEAGVRLVHVNWTRNPGDNAVDNPMWDTHAQNADRLEDVLCPQFDIGFSALIEDLDQRGLLDETLVVAVGEFGRTPKINHKGGRDHWGSVFSFAMAGAGIAGGQVYGASDKKGAYPVRDRVEPGDLTTTIYHLLGINYRGMFLDREGREHRITENRPLTKILGTEPATLRRTTPGGDINRVLPYDESLLLNTNFEDHVPLRPTTFGSRPKGWRAGPLADPKHSSGLIVKLIDNGQPRDHGGRRHVEIGLDANSGSKGPSIAQGDRAILAQEIRNPRPGRFVFSVHARGDGTSRASYEDLFLKNFTCRLVIYRYTELTKDPVRSKELASVEFQPSFPEPNASEYERFQLAKLLINPTPGSNFAVGLGLGVGVIVEKTSPGLLQWTANNGPQRALIRIDNVELRFTGKDRNDDVKV